MKFNIEITIPGVGTYTYSSFTETQARTLANLLRHDAEAVSHIRIYDDRGRLVYELGT